MIVTVPKFSEITGISRDTVYSWIYRDKYPEGIKRGNSALVRNCIHVGQKSEHYEKIKKALG